ncbi:DegV family protein [Caldibacillus thermolactis]|jgi:DegV family protein with EDD domain|uniref:DegV family protein n=1 Tax=Pallidibacillus thermolactis TaxID=251051 RepID=A0ABT2WI28_9BACI|nr:DegV family protein [Pallidibacillus thermolactis]MCU9595077.1 DegV family protein [Pallidibacillus thermolactis]MED1674563.1 DegV family protein [Pallidibacillus thermolactis subsp. kokeshiiformis]
MSKVKITCDSTADLSHELLQKYNIDTIPLYIIIDENTYRDSVDIQPDDIYAYAQRTGKLPKTAAVSVQNYIDLFAKYQEYDAIIHINIGQQFSSSFQNAYIASQEFKNVYVINSENLSTGSGHLVIEAAELAAQGLDAEQICENLKRVIPKIDASFVIDTLDYLKMGGRCSSIQAFGASLLNIKPCIEVIDGKMEVGKKYRGKIEKSIQKYVVDRLKDRDDIITDRVFITHSGCSVDLLNQVKQLVIESQPFEEVFITRASCTISCHCGPNTLGVLFKTK